MEPVGAGLGGDWVRLNRLWAVFFHCDRKEAIFVSWGNCNKVVGTRGQRLPRLIPPQAPRGIVRGSLLAAGCLGFETRDSSLRLVVLWHSPVCVIPGPFLRT